MAGRRSLQMAPHALLRGGGKIHHRGRLRLREILQMGGMSGEGHRQPPIPLEPSGAAEIFRLYRRAEQKDC